MEGIIISLMKDIDDLKQRVRTLEENKIGVKGPRGDKGPPGDVGPPGRMGMPGPCPSAESKPKIGPFRHRVIESSSSDEGGITACQKLMDKTIVLLPMNPNLDISIIKKITIFDEMRKFIQIDNLEEHKEHVYLYGKIDIPFYGSRYPLPLPLKIKFLKLDNVSLEDCMTKIIISMYEYPHEDSFGVMSSTDSANVEYTDLIKELKRLTLLK